MRYLPSPDFSSKLGAMSSADIQRLGSFLEKAGACDKATILSEGSIRVNLLGENVYLATQGPTRIYFTFGDDDEGEYILLLDITTEQSKKETGDDLFAAKNPRSNNSLNPKFNSSINPQKTSNLNPRFNSTINPKLNSSINPKFNSSLNPRFNLSINPRQNWGFGGPFLYNKELKQEGYLVRANDIVDLVFDLSGSFSGILVEANDQVRVQFDQSNDWVGYLVRASEDVALRFSIGGDWIGIAV